MSMHGNGEFGNTAVKTSVITAGLGKSYDNTVGKKQTPATRCITANVLQTSKVDAQCDKLATKLG